VHARSALFDLYGDHLLSRGGQAPVAALVRLLAPLRISGPAARTAVSRMARQGWLVPVRLDAGPGYQLTPRGERRMRQAADRVYHHAPPPWDGRWHVVILHRVPERARRDRLRSALGFLGYACLDGATWISPRPSTELDSLLATERIGAERFVAAYDGDAAQLAARAWDIDGLGRAYLRWLAMARDLTGQAAGWTGPGTADGTSPGSPEWPDERVFATRSELVHEWRKFLFVDPGLPAELLPAQWPGIAAAEFFDNSAARLLPAAARFVDRCLTVHDK